MDSNNQAVITKRALFYAIVKWLMLDYRCLWDINDTNSRSYHQRWEEYYTCLKSRERTIVDDFVRRHLRGIHTNFRDNRNSPDGLDGATMCISSESGQYVVRITSMDDKTTTIFLFTVADSFKIQTMYDRNVYFANE